MTTIYLVTSNPGKIESINNILGSMNLDFKIEILNAEYPEDKSEETTQKVVLSGAKWCAEKYNKPVLVTDAGLFIKELNGFPGINIKFTLSRIGNEGILKLMEGKNNREAEWILSIGYCEPSMEPIEFTSSFKGIISEEMKGDKGFGFDSIFVPERQTATLAEQPELRDTNGPFKELILKFSDWFKKREKEELEKVFRTELSEFDKN